MEPKPERRPLDLCVCGHEFAQHDGASGNGCQACECSGVDARPLRERLRERDNSLKANLASRMGMLGFGETAPGPYQGYKKKVWPPPSRRRFDARHQPVEADECRLYCLVCHTPVGQLMADGDRVMVDTHDGPCGLPCIGSTVLPQNEDHTGYLPHHTRDENKCPRCSPKKCPACFGRGSHPNKAYINGQFAGYLDVRYDGRPLQVCSRCNGRGTVPGAEVNYGLDGDDNA